MQQTETIEYIDGLGDSPGMVLINDAKIVILVNKRKSKDEQQAYVRLVYDELSED